jgi:HD superfamily phosphodiesterase
VTEKKLKEMEELLLSLGGSYMLNHAKRTLHISKILAEKENIEYNLDILIFACYFHDISAYPPYRPEGKFDHALESSKIIPKLAKDFGYDDANIEIIIEAVKYHDKANMGEYNETKLVRNADGIDYLGYMAVARDFSKSPTNMKNAIDALKKHRQDFAAIIELDYAKKLAESRIKEIDNFIKMFEEESFGLY